MKKTIRLTESDLTRIVKRVINEETNTTPFTHNSKVKIPIKKNNTFIVILLDKDNERGGITSYYFTVVESTFRDMPYRYSNFLYVNYNNNTYKLGSPYSEDGETGGILQRGPITDIQVVKKN